VILLAQFNSCGKIKVYRKKVFGGTMPILQTARFACDTTPYALHSFHMEGDNQVFLDSIDPDYYLHIAHINAAALETDERQYAAVQLRTAYSQAIETLFVLLAAVAQAPRCPAGWVLCYHSAELYNLARKILNGDEILTHLKSKPITWEVLARVTLPLNIENETQRKEIQAAFGEFWRSLAEEWVKKDFTEEYNSVKHGLRARLHGYSLNIGREESPGIPAPPENMITVAASEFGLQFFSTAPITDKRNLKLVSIGHNWHPQKFVLALELITTSIRNVLVFLKSMNGVPRDQLQLQIPGDLAQFDAIWEYQEHSGSMSWSSNIEPTMITTLSKEQILADYNPEEEPPTSLSES
jgi:hypothetical protein